MGSPRSASLSLQGSAQWSPDGRGIAYQGTNSSGKNYGIYEFELSDKNLIRVADNVQYGDSLFSWGPDGNSIAYQTQSNEIDVVELATGQRRSVGHGYYPTWSPDGKSIAYWMGEKEGYAICDSRTGQVVSTVKGNFPSGALVWSPDNRYVAYVGLSTGLLPHLLAYFGEEYHGELYVTDLEDNVTARIYSFHGTIYPTGWAKLDLARN